MRWLRPDYQIPRSPRTPADRPPAVLAALEAAGEPLDVAGLTQRFKKGGKRIEQAVIKALASLVRWGHVTALPGDRYVGRSQRKEAI